MDHYQILNIAPNASEQEIRIAYRTLIKKYHPDRNHSAEARELTARLNEAYDVLSDPQKKFQYDNRFHQAFSEPVYEEDPREVYRREYIKRKQREKQAAHQREEQWRKGVFHIMRVVNFLILAHAITQTIDYFIPGRIYEESAIHMWQERRGGGKHTYIANLIQTAHFTIRVPDQLYIDYYNADEPKTLLILETAILKIARQASFDDGKKTNTFTLPDTLYAFGLTKPLILLAITMGILFIRRYSYSTFQFCFIPVAVILILLVI